MSNKKHENDLERLFGLIHPSKLSAHEKESVWCSIAQRIETQPMPMTERPTVSPWQLHALFRNPMMATIALFLSIMLAGGGTVMAADNARPGDLLFRVDTTVENARLALASEKNKAELKVRFAQERIAEVESLVSEDGRVHATGTVSTAEADIFSNETVVSVSFEGGAKTFFTTSADTRAEIAAEIASRFSLSAEEADRLLVSVETEDRASRTDDKKALSLKLSESAKVNIQTGIEAAAAFLTDVSASAKASGETELAAKLDAALADLNTQLNGLPENVRINIKDDKLRVQFDSSIEAKATTTGKEKFEVKTDDGMIRVEIKDGGLDLKIKSSKSEDEDEDVDVRTDVSVSSRSTGGLTEAEATVVGSASATVIVEVNDEKTVFTTNAGTREDIVLDILNRFPGTTRAQVESVLKIETKSSATIDGSSSSDD
jgi:hypothetical protein